MKFKEISERWKTFKQNFVKKSTFSAYVLLLENHILPEFGEMESVEEMQVQDFVLKKLNSGLSQKSVKDVLIVLKMIMKFGNKHKLIHFASFDIQYPTVREHNQVEVLTREHQKKVMDYVKQHFTFRNMGVYLCLSTGMRIGEICALTWEDVDTDNQVIHVRKTIQRIYIIEDGKRRTELLLDTPKTKNSIREIPMSKELLMMLKPFKKIVNSEFFFLTNDAKPTEPRTYRSYFNNLIMKLPLPPMKFHGLRHSFATRCIERKCEYKTVSVLLGHSNISTTLNLYVHPNAEQKRGAINQMCKGLK